MKDSDIKKDLVFAYHLFAKFGWDDLTYTHLSARAADQLSFYILPFGLLFQEVTVSNLIKVDFNGNVVEGVDMIYNPTGYVIHGSIYSRRSDINAIFHSHTHANVAVSATKKGLQPISQWALHFYDQIGYHPYDSLALNLKTQGDNIAEDIGKNMVLVMENHGAVVCGQTVPEAFYFHHHFENACKVQCMINNNQKDMIIPDTAVCKRSNKDLLSFEKARGSRDWSALKRLYGNEAQHKLSDNERSSKASNHHCDTELV